MNEYKKFITKIFFIAIVNVFIFALVPSVGFGQPNEQLIVAGRVIGVEQPERGWAMEFESVKIFYLRIDKVLKGKSNSKYIRIAYGYNPSSSPQHILPEEMFNGKTHWKFNLYERENFDKKVSVSKSEGDWYDRKYSGTIKGIDFLPDDDSLKNKELEVWTTEITPKCVPIAGYEKQVAALEKLDLVKGYWLDFEGKHFEKTKN